MSWTQPICEACWIDGNAVTSDNGWGVRVPTRLIDPHLEMCSFCGKPTLVGIYIRVDPKTVPYPRPDADADA